MTCLKLKTMKHIFRYLASTLSIRLSLLMACSTAVLLMASLAIVLQCTWKTVKQEALQDAEQSLAGTVLQIDNILLSIEQAAGNVYWDLLLHLRDADGQRLQTYCRKLIESNPYIAGCAIALDTLPSPFTYHLSPFTYLYRVGESTKQTLKRAEAFGSQPYYEQLWYAEPMKTGQATWIGPLKDEKDKDEALLTFCLPIFGTEGKPIGVMGVDMNLKQLSKIILSTKPSPNSYCTLLAGDGSYIVHPDSRKLKHHTVFSYYEGSNNQSIRDAASAMVSGKTGYTKFRQDGSDYYVFYKPFQRVAVPGRTQNKLSWSTGIVYPKEDILSEYYHLIGYGYGISLAGLFILVVSFCIFSRRQLQPLRMLTASARHISQGHYNTHIPHSRQEDEVGRLQDNFQRMQQSLAVHVSELEQLRASLLQQEQQLNAAYEKAQEADRMKTAFLHNMTDQMMAPANAIADRVSRLHDDVSAMSDEGKGVCIEEEIQRHSKTITSLLSKMLDCTP